MKILAFTVLFFVMFSVIATAKPTITPCTQDVKHAKDISTCLKGDVYLSKSGKATWNEEAIAKMQAVEAPKHAKSRNEQARQIFYFFVVAIPVSAILFLLFFAFRVALASFIYRIISGSYTDNRRRKRAARQLEAKRRKAQQTMA